ncbi:trypsin-like peptidase domain-containing protein [Thermomicrobiaceae bacterium CFH 74404]|uniref:Trypsin-like peptidase domain-containing protein n=1 Tax=Thermalbibacter longus TaxID=2951981 RepID=A0AA42BEB3_9BACT|nr:trypsin-like peptidase domain-containing protein [Thermalbibacter longus]MCM8750603.1 trypsin-like peptidase domain-containing protein [Thermalbibacter longus]
MMLRARQRLIPLTLLLIVLLALVASCSARRPEPSPSATSTPASSGAMTPSTNPSNPVPATAPATVGSQGTGDLATAVEQVAREVSPAVAFVTVRKVETDIFGFGQVVQGEGSGVVFDERGYILTNDHVVGEALEIVVVLPDGRQFTGRVVGRSPENDIAVIKIDGDNLPVAKLGDSDTLRVGQWVVAIGNALGLEGGPTVTAGVVSALNRTLQPGPNEPPFGPLIQTDAAINPGNSGGPLVSLQGEVIGINTAKIQQAEGIGFAIPINRAREIASQIVEARPQPYLGISGVTVTRALVVRFNLPVDRGVLVVSVAPGSPAEQAGLTPGDIIVRFGGQEVTRVSDLEQALRQHQPGDQVEIVINREGSERSLTVTLGEAPVIR